MTLKSRADRYGKVAVSIHWLSAILILALLGSGFRAANTMDAAEKAGFLRFHIPVAIIVLLLTLLRIVWWWRFDRKPLPVKGSPAWQELIARWVQVAFYVVILAMAASGVGMMVLSGAAPAIFGQTGAALPNFTDYPPRAPHGLGAFALVALFAFHGGAALYHHFTAATDCCGACGTAHRTAQARSIQRSQPQARPIADAADGPPAPRR